MLNLLDRSLSIEWPSWTVHMGSSDRLVWLKTVYILIGSQLLGPSTLDLTQLSETELSNGSAMISAKVIVNTMIWINHIKKLKNWLRPSSAVNLEQLSKFLWKSIFSKYFFKEIASQKQVKVHVSSESPVTFPGCSRLLWRKGRSQHSFVVSVLRHCFYKSDSEQ